MKPSSSRGALHLGVRADSQIRIKLENFRIKLEN